MSRPRPPMDLGRTAAVAWIIVAVAVTVIIGPNLGLRGWAWLSVHHLLCAVGASHELWRAHKRRLAWEARQGEG